MTTELDTNIEQQPDRITLAEVDTLRSAGLISGRRYLDAVYRCREPELWTRWALRAMLALGAGHLLAGIIFFFAYNWDDLTPTAKFALLEVGIVIAVIAALMVKLERLGGQVLLIAGFVLVGALLAVVGQVYQAGADAFDLFVAWAILILPWVVVSRSAAHWLVWLVVFFAAVNLYAFQVLIPLDLLSAVQFASILAVTLAAMLALRELAVRTGAAWLAAGWTRLLLAFAALAIVISPAIGYVLDWHSEGIAVAAFLLLLVAAVFVYARLLPDFPVIALSTGFVALFLMAVGWRVLYETIGFDWNLASSILPSLILLVAWCAALTAGMLKSLAFLRRQIGTDGGGD